MCVNNVNIPVGGFLSPAIHPVHPDGLIEAGHRPVSESCGNYPSTGRPTNLEAWRYLLTLVMVDDIPLLYEKIKTEYN